MTVRTGTLMEIPRLRFQITFFLSSSHQRLVCQCPEQPSCGRHEVPWWKTDCANHWTVQYLPARLLPQQRKDLCWCEWQIGDHDSNPRNKWGSYLTRCRCFQPERRWHHHRYIGCSLQALYGSHSYLLWRVSDLRIWLVATAPLP